MYYHIFVYCLLLSNHLTFIIALKESVDEVITRKRSASKISVQIEHPEFYSEYESLKDKALNLLEEKCNLRTTIHNLKEFNRTFVETGSVTIIRSLFETYLKVYENRLWAFAGNLQWYLLRTEDNPYLDGITEQQLILNKLRSS